MWVRSRVSSESMRPDGGLSAVGEAEQQVADALEADHELHAGEKFAGFGGLDFGDDRGDGAVDFHVEGVEFALALAEGIEQRAGTGGDAFGGGAGGFFGQTTGFDGAADDVMMGRFGSGRLSTRAVLMRVSLWRGASGADRLTRWTYCAADKNRWSTAKDRVSFRGRWVTGK